MIPFKCQKCSTISHHDLPLSCPKCKSEELIPIAEVHYITNCDESERASYFLDRFKILCSPASRPNHFSCTIPEVTCLKCIQLLGDKKK